jgi:hypothetical protein
MMIATSLASCEMVRTEKMKTNTLPPAVVGTRSP